MTDSPSWPASRHVSVWIGVSTEVAYAFASDPHNLPRWAAGLASSAVEQVGDRWAMSSPLGEVTVQFAPDNAVGVLDHVVRTPAGQAFYNPMRVVPADDDPGTCEVVFTVRRRPGVTDAEFEADSAAVRADLDTLKGLLEG